MGVGHSGCMIRRLPAVAEGLDCSQARCIMTQTSNAKRAAAREAWITRRKNAVAANHS
jgi:hypothetical protein